MQRIRIVFRKDGPARYLSHLDLMATLEFAMRRAGLPLEISGGFSPRPRFSLAAPLSLGHIGEREILEVELREEMPVSTALQRLQAGVPAGITLVEAASLPAAQKSAASSIAGATYRVVLSEAVPDLAQRVEALLRQDEIVVEEQRNDGIRRRDLRSMLQSIEPPDTGTLVVTVRLDGTGTIRPEQIVELLGLPTPVQITREQLHFL